MADSEPVVIRISPMAHFAVGFLALGLLAVVMTAPWAAPVLIVPVLLSLLVIRLRTVADADTLTARSLLDATTVGWDEVAGLRFEKSRWARAELTSGTRLRLPAVTFATLPLLAQASNGKVPNPYS